MVSVLLCYQSRHILRPRSCSAMHLRCDTTSDMEPLTGAFWLALGITLTPFYNAQAYYDTQSGGSAEYAASFGTYCSSHAVTSDDADPDRQPFSICAWPW